MTTREPPLACLFCGGPLTRERDPCPQCGCVRPLAPRVQTPLTGREREITLLRGHIDRAVAGQGGVVGLAGPAGIGKTRLLEEALAYAKRQRCWDFAVRGFEPGTDLAYWPLIEALHAELAPPPVPDAGRAAVAPSGARELLAALQGAQEAPRDATAGFEPRDAAVNARVYTALVAVLRDLTATRPLVILADDLHWFDLPTLNLMRYTVRLTRTLPILLLCAYRDDGEADTRWRPVLADAAHEGLFTEVRLDGLTPAEARRLALEAAGGSLEDRAVQEVLRLAEGNPFYIGQLVHAVTAAPTGRPAPLPAALRGLTAHRLAPLSPACRALLQAMAVAGRDCPPDLLARVTELSLPRLAMLLDEALAARVLVEREGAGTPGRYGFAHPLLREAVLRDVNTVAQADLHLRLAEALHARRAAGGHESAGEIADHYLGARPLAPHDRTLDYTRAAADEAAGLGAHDQAARYLNAAIELMAETTDNAPPTTATIAARTRLMLEYGQAGDSAAAEREAETVLAYWRTVGDARAEAEVQARYAEHLNPRRHPREVIARTEAALALIGDERSPLAARLRFLRAHARLMVDDSADLLPTAEWLATGGFAPPEPAAAVWQRLLRLLWHIWHVPDTAAILALCRETVVHTRATGDRRALAMARLWEAEILNRDARPRAALVALDEAQRLAQEIGSAPMLVDGGALRAEALLQLGRWQELERVVDETLPVLVRLQSTYFGYALLTAHAWSRRLRGLPWTAPPGLEVRFHDSMAFVAAYRANFAREQVEFGGRDDRTDRLLDWLSANVPRRGASLAWATAGIPLLGTLALAGRPDEVAARYEPAHPFGRFLQGASFGPLELARAAIALRRWDDATAHLDAAAQLAAEEGLLVAQARALVERGRLYRRRGRRGDRARAAEVLKRAAEICDGLGLGPDRERARALLAELRAGPPPTLPAGLTPREADVLRLLAAGHSNRQIAAALTISEKTVEQHVLNLYQKLQVNSRAGAVAFAFSHGLMGDAGDHPVPH